METVRLEKSATFTTCSLDLENPYVEDSEPWAMLSQPLTTYNGGLETCDENPVSNPLILTSLDITHVVLNENSAEKQDASAATKLIFMMGGFLVCWLPYFVWLPTVHLLDLQTPSHVYLIILWVGYFNSAINPVIYVLHLQDIKRVLSKYIIDLKNCFCGGEKSDDFEFDGF